MGLVDQRRWEVLSDTRGPAVVFLPRSWTRTRERPSRRNPTFLLQVFWRSNSGRAAWCVRRFGRAGFKLVTKSLTETCKYVSPGLSSLPLT
mgnify:CR=1 FL=1